MTESRPMVEARNTAVSDSSACWPALPLDAWRDTRDTLHMWTQIVGKIRLALTPLVNHWWNVPLYVTARGLTTSPIPYGDRVFEIEFDFIEHQLADPDQRSGDEDDSAGTALGRRFYQEFMRDAALARHRREDLEPMPVEIPDPIRFDQDAVHASYDAEYVAALLAHPRCRSTRVFKEFRARFIGKCSPVHFFWGSFDLAVTRFSGRRAPRAARRRPHHARGLLARSEQRRLLAGRRRVKGPAFYSYAAPEPPGIREQHGRPAGGFYHGKQIENSLAA